MDGILQEEENVEKTELRMEDTETNIGTDSTVPILESESFPQQGNEPSCGFKLKELRIILKDIRSEYDRQENERKEQGQELPEDTSDIEDASANEYESKEKNENSFNDTLIDETQEEGQDYVPAAEMSTKRRKSKSSAKSARFECKVCRKTFAGHGGLGKHIGHIKECRDEYGPEFERMMAEFKKQTRMEYYKKNRENIIMRQKLYYQQNRLEKVQKQAEYYQEKAAIIRQNKRLRRKLARLQVSVSSAEGKIIKTKKCVKTVREKHFNKYACSEPIEPKGNVKVILSPETNEHLKMPILECDELDHKPGSTKLNHDATQDGQELLTLPEGYTLRGAFAKEEDIEHAESFVGMTLSGDGESIEVRHLMHLSNINLDAFQLLMHSVLAVLDTDMKTFAADRTCPFLVQPWERGGLVSKSGKSSKESVRNKLMMELVKSGERPRPPTSHCNPPRSSETHFLSQHIDPIPHIQLLMNSRLQPVDMGAIGVQVRVGEEKDVVLMPIFTVNTPVWQVRARIFNQILVNWIGTLDKVDSVGQLLPCVMEAKERNLHEIKMDCFEKSMMKNVKVCPTCGLKFEMNPYLYKDKDQYLAHIGSHQTTCKVCGKECHNATNRRFHERTHNKDHVKCTADPLCPFVSRSQSSMETHIKFKHTSHICEQCGREFPKLENLTLHIRNIHMPKVDKPRIYDCNICGVAFKDKATLKRHVKRHQNKASQVNQWRRHFDEIKEYKYVCHLHDNCKKYFKDPSGLRLHLKNFENKPYPKNVRRQFLPDPSLLPDPSTLITLDIAENGPKKIKKEDGSSLSTGDGQQFIPTANPQAEDHEFPTFMSRLKHYQV